MPKKSTTKSKVKTERDKARTKSGKYDYENMELVCTCGHQLGNHLAEWPHGCIAWDSVPGVEWCDCEKFVKSLSN